MRWATESGSARSNSTAVAVPPATEISSAVCCAPSVTMSPTTTRQPSAPSLIAVAAPIPLAPPATTATLPSSPRIPMHHPSDGLFLGADFTSRKLMYAECFQHRSTTELYGEAPTSVAADVVTAVGPHALIEITPTHR